MELETRHIVIGLLLGGALGIMAIMFSKPKPEPSMQIPRSIPEAPPTHIHPVHIYPAHGPAPNVSVTTFQIIDRKVKGSLLIEWEKSTDLGSPAHFELTGFPFYEDGYPKDMKFTYSNLKNWRIDHERERFEYTGPSDQRATLAVNFEYSIPKHPWEELS